MVVFREHDLATTGVELFCELLGSTLVALVYSIDEVVIDGTQLALFLYELIEPKST